MEKKKITTYKPGDTFYIVYPYEGVRVMKLQYEKASMEDDREIIETNVLGDSYKTYLAIYADADVHKTRESASKELEQLKQEEVMLIADTYSSVDDIIKYLFSIAEEGIEDYDWALEGLKKSLEKLNIHIEDDTKTDEDDTLYYIEIVQHEHEAYRQYIIKSKDSDNIYTTYYMHAKRDNEETQSKFTMQEVKEIDEINNTNYRFFTKKVEDVDEQARIDKKNY